jgi:hypothetical protein
MTMYRRLRVLVPRIPHYAGLIAGRRRAARDPRPVLALLSGIGDDNFGDEWMYEALERGMPDCRFVPLQLPGTERRLVRLGLSGPEFFTGLVVGGGTLVNRYFLDRARPLLEVGTPAWMLGTGVGSAGFGVTEGSADPDSWAPFLPSFRRLAVRGPLSVQRLEGFGAEVVGDLALFHTPDEPQPAAGRRLLLVNISGTEGENAIGGLADDHVEGMAAEAVKIFRQDGWLCAPLVVHRDDEPRLERLGHAIGGWDAPVVHVRSGEDAERAMESAGALVASRLHATVLGWMFGVPTVALAYRDKTLDLATSLNASDDVVDLRSDDLEDVARVARLVKQSDGTAQRAVHVHAVAARERIRTLLASVQSEVLDLSTTGADPARPDGSRR